MPIHALVTGASRGVGRAIALELADRGARLALVARRAEPLQRVAEEVLERGGAAAAFPYDLTRTDGLKDLIGAVADRLGRIEALINNAGAFDFRPVQEADLARWDGVLDVNLRAPIHLTRHALPHLRRERASAVINIASVAGKDYVPGGAIYSASKFGLVGFGGCLFEDVRDAGVKVCTIAPGQVAARVDHVRPDTHDLIPVGDVAKVVAFVLEFPGSSCPTEIVMRAQHSPARRSGGAG